MQREMLKRKADNISCSAAETHSFAQVTNLSVQAGNRLLPVVSHVSCCRFLGDCEGADGPLSHRIKHGAH